VPLCSILLVPLFGVMRLSRTSLRLSPAAVIEPSGNASAAATFSRSGVSGVIFSGDGILEMAQHMISRQTSASAFNNLQAQYLTSQPRLCFLHPNVHGAK
jgi:hypothetical protein